MASEGPRTKKYSENFQTGSQGEPRPGNRTLPFRTEYSLYGWWTHQETSRDTRQVEVIKNIFKHSM